MSGYDLAVHGKSGNVCTTTTMICRRLQFCSIALACTLIYITYVLLFKTSLPSDLLHENTSNVLLYGKVKINQKIAKYPELSRTEIMTDGNKNQYNEKRYEKPIMDDRIHNVNLNNEIPGRGKIAYPNKIELRNRKSNQGANTKALYNWFTPTKRPMKGNTMAVKYTNYMGEDLTHKARKTEIVNKLKRQAKALNLTLQQLMKARNITEHTLLIKSKLESDIYENKSFVHKAENINVEAYQVFSDPNIGIRIPTHVEMHNNVWQLQKGDSEIYLYSAYYDDRPALQQNLLRIIAVAESDVTNLVCLIWYKDQLHPDISRASKKEISSKISPRLEKQYEAYVFTCNMMPGKNSTPQHVSIVTTEQKEPTNCLEVRYPTKVPENERIEFGHCMSVIYWDHNPYRIVEWLELHKMWGIGEVNIYANNLNHIIRKIFKYYANEGFVNIHEITNVIDDGSEWTILLDMSPAINDCLYKNMYRYKNIVCTDTDEMIVPIMQQNYSNMIRQINKEQHVTHPAPSYIFRNVYFFTDFGPVFRKPVILHTQRYIKHIKPSVFGYSAKSITNPQTCTGMQNHICWKRIPKLDKIGWLVDVKMKYGMNFHYKKCHFDDYLDKEGECASMMKNNTETFTMRRFGSDLFPRVRDVLERLELL